MPRYQFSVDGVRTQLELPEDGEAARVAKELFIQYLIRLNVLGAPFKEPHIEVKKLIWTSRDARPRVFRATG